MTMRATATAIVRTGDTLSVQGAMTYGAARQLDKDAAGLLKGGAVLVDLSAVSEIDSAALAVLFSWQRLQARHGGTLGVRAAPDALHTLARVYGATDQLTWL